MYIPLRDIARWIREHAPQKFVLIKCSLVHGLCFVTMMIATYSFEKNALRNC